MSPSVKQTGFRGLRCVVGLLASILVVAIALLYWCLFVQVTNAGLAFENDLKIPPEMEFTINPDGTKEFVLRVQHRKTEFMDGKPADTLGVNSTYLGQTIRAERGDRVLLNVHNELKETTTMHWHGMHVPAEMDGTPHQTIRSSESWTADFEITQEAGILWYHPHTHGKTAEQVYFGIAGLFIVEDENSKSLDIPDTYGVDDIPLIIQDRLFHEDGSLDYQIRNGANFGESIVVNGTLDPYLEVEARKIRFRILNGSNARIYWLGFDDQREFEVIATDGGFLDSPVTVDRVRLSPGERAEIVVDFSKGDSVKLKSFPDAGLLETTSAWFGGTTNGHFDIMEIRPKNPTRESHNIPESLNRIHRIDPETAAVRRVIILGGMVINGKSMDMKRIDERVRLGDTEVWSIRNRTGRTHPFHIHLVQFLILDRDGRPPAAEESGWKDTVHVESGENVNVIMQFKQFANPDVPYMYHCHILEHEDRGMMGQFLVVDE